MAVISEFLASKRPQAGWWPWSEDGDGDQERKRRDAERQIQEIDRKTEEAVAQLRREAEDEVGRLVDRNAEIDREMSSMSRDDLDYDELRREKGRNKRKIKQIEDDLERQIRQHEKAGERLKRTHEIF